METEFHRSRVRPLLAYTGVTLLAVAGGYSWGRHTSNEARAELPGLEAEAHESRQELVATAGGVVLADMIDTLTGPYYYPEHQLPSNEPLAIAHQRNVALDYADDVAKVKHATDVRDNYPKMRAILAGLTSVPIGLFALSILPRRKQPRLIAVVQVTLEQTPDDN